jgi:S-DNA-T family DNA segregation ATPase FtsK/SpoIIIE
VALYDGWDPPRPGWTCAECGFDYDATDLASVVDLVRAFGRRYRAPLTRGLRDEDLDAVLRARPAPDTWSALEYACHVRDALAVYDRRIGKALAEDRPVVQQMNRDAVVIERAYNAQDPAVVADELAASAERLADRLASVDGADWDRVVVREGEDLSVAWMARNAVHEGDHHLLDVGRALRHARTR